MANGDKTILYVDKVAIDNYIVQGQGQYYMFNTGVYKSVFLNGTTRYDAIVEDENAIISTSSDWCKCFNTGFNISDSTEVVQINSKDYYKLDSYICTTGYTYSSGQKLFFAIGGDTMNYWVIAENNFEQTVVEFDYDLNKVTPDYFLWDVTDGVESLKISYTEPPHKIISEIQYPDETIYDIKDKNALNKSQITNCLLEVPQRIKYTLVDGTLTIKAGSVVIVPYGTEDKTADLPKGATFINENFKVYDTQFSDGKFFVWAELVNDATDTPTVEDIANRPCYIDFARVIPILYKTEGSGTTNPSSGTGVYFNTNDNKVVFYNSGAITDKVISLPILRGTSDGTHTVSSIDQVFNGMGYIGSTVWVDKGVKGLIPNGRNEDGTLRNIKFVTNSVLLDTFKQSESDSWHIVIADYGIRLSHASTTKTRSFDEELNYIKKDGVIRTDISYIGNCNTTNGVITSFQPKLPFRAIDYSDIWYDSSTQTLHIGG